MKIQSYKELLVWEKSIALVEKIYKITTKLPSSEQWGLCSQMRRASISIPSNIAEGFGRQATGEYRHHLSYSRGSALELETQLIIAEKLGFITFDESKQILNEIDQISRMLATLIAKIKNTNTINKSIKEL